MQIPALARTPQAGAAIAIAATTVLTGVLAPVHDEVGLLNVGIEDLKGNDQVKRAARLITTMRGVVVGKQEIAARVRDDQTR